MTYPPTHPPLYGTQSPPYRACSRGWQEGLCKASLVCVCMHKCSQACRRGFQHLVWRNPTPVAVTPKIYSPSSYSFPLLSPVSSLSPSSSYHPYTACPGGTAVEDIMLCCGSLWEREKDFKKCQKKNKGWKERVWETEREHIRHSGSRRHAELLATYTCVFL